MTRKRGAAIAALLAVAVVGVILVTGGGDSGTDSSGSPSTSTATTTIKRQDLVEVDTEDGTLGYADERDVVNRLSGTVTWVAAAGDIVRLDHTLYKVDGEPVILMNGTVPAYRTLSASSSASGRDVQQLEHGLRALGYDSGKSMTVDGTWDSGTTAAVERWQTSHDFTANGVIELGRLVFQPHSRRIATVAVSLGSSSSSGASGTGGQGATQGVAHRTSTPAVQVVNAVWSGGATAHAAQLPTETTTTTTTATTTPTSPTPTTTKTTPTTTTPRTATKPRSTPTAPSGARSAAPSGGGMPSGGAAPSGGASAASTASGGSGSAPSNTIMTTTSTSKVVTVDLPTTKSSLARLGARVSVELPGGATVHGRISEIGKVATKETTSSSGGTGSTSSSSQATIKVTIRLFTRSSTLDQAPVTVSFEQNRAKNVLSVPVTALLAQSGGRFAVEVVEDGDRRLVPVTPGIFTSGYVEIDGDGLKPGMRVTNAAVQ